MIKMSQKLTLSLAWKRWIIYNKFGIGSATFHNAGGLHLFLLRKLVIFGQHNGVRLFVSLKKADHRPVWLHCWMTWVKKQHNQRDSPPLHNIGREEGTPQGFFSMTDGRIAITGKIDKIEMPINKKIVDQSCFSRGWTGLARPLMPVRELSSVDFPTLDLPAKTISGKDSSGRPERAETLMWKVELTIFIQKSGHKKRAAKRKLKTLR